ncbi:helix-turn-helix domain-containing protein [Streptomyces sp. NPDC001513]|uniref:helix-turn-helix domain-containing protein n=1 Tax=Streptomyces sp. NPDC001513 TaxID=3364580 RepID=UPI0036952BB2
MTESPNFSAMLTCLLDHRGVSAGELADRASVTADEIQGVLAGRTPSEGLLRRLATALGFHAADLFILAGLEVPDDLTPLDAAATPWIAHIVMDAVHLPAAGRSELLQFIRGLPQEERRSPFVPKESEPLADGPGGSLIRMFWYRNLSRSGLAHAMAVVTPTYLSAYTYYVIGDGRAELTPRLVTDFGTLLGIDARELAALTGVVLPETPGPAAPEAVDAAAVLWELRRLSAPQAEHVAELANSLRGDSRAEYRINAPGW